MSAPAQVRCPECGREVGAGVLARHRLTHTDPGSLLMATADERAEMVRLYRRGGTLDSIGSSMHYSRSAVRRALLVEGVAMRRRGGQRLDSKQRLSPEALLVTAQLYGRGMSMRAIAETLGLTISSIHQRLHTYGVPVRSPGGDQRSPQARARQARSPSGRYA